MLAITVTPVLAMRERPPPCPRPHRPCPDSSPVHQREGAALRAREAARGRQFQAGARMPLNPRPEGSGELGGRDSRGLPSQALRGDSLLHAK